MRQDFPNCDSPCEGERNSPSSIQEGHPGAFAGARSTGPTSLQKLQIPASAKIQGGTPPTPQSLPTLPSTSHRPSVQAALFPISPSVPNSGRTFRATAQTLPVMPRPRTRRSHSAINEATNSTKSKSKKKTEARGHTTHSFRCLCYLEYMTWRATGGMVSLLQLLTRLFAIFQV